jgi:hypothetical protein
MTSPNWDGVLCSKLRRRSEEALRGALPAVPSERSLPLLGASSSAAGMASPLAATGCKACAGRHFAHTCGRRRQRSDERAEGCVACLGQHKAHTCGVRGHGQGDGSGGRRPRVTGGPASNAAGLPMPFVAPRPELDLGDIDDDDDGAAALAPERLAGDTRVVQRGGGSGAAGGADGTVARANACTTAVVVGGDGEPASWPRRDWARSHALQHTTWLCLTCKHASPKDSEACVQCGTPAPQASSAAWKQVQQRRESNLAGSLRVRQLSYFQQREQHTESLTSSMGAPPHRPASITAGRVDVGACIAARARR